MSNPQEPRSASALGVLREHLPLVATILSAFLITFRLLSVAGYDPQTAFALLQAAGTGAVIFGTILSNIGWVPVVIGMIVLATHESLARRFTFSVVVAAIALSYVTGIFIAPVLGMIMLTGGILFDIYFHWSVRRARRKYGDLKPDRDNPAQLARYQASIKEHNHNLERAKKRVLPVAPIIQAAVVIAGVALSTEPWVPAEELTITSGQPITAYVLSTEPDFTAVLTTGLPRIRYIATHLISQRRLCVLGFTGLAWRTLPELTTPARYPSCSSLDH